jgi:plastocyanin
MRLIATAALLVSMAACGESSTPVAPTRTNPAPSPTPPPLANTASVSIVPGAQVLTTTAFNPNPITIGTGTTVTWTNNDSNVAHTSTADGGAWDSGALAPGAAFSHTFNTVGTFTYHCRIHPNMVGTVSVIQ